MKRTYIMIALLALAAPSLAQSTSLSLNDALRALPQSPEWRSADLAYETALRNLEVAQAASGFKLTPGASYGLSSSSSAAASELSASITASLGVLPWSPSADAVRSAARALERAELTRRDTRNTLYTNLSTRYFNLQLASSNVAVAQATLDLRQNQLRVATARNQAGNATLEDVLTAQQNLASASSNLASAQGALELARLTLANTLGTSPQSLGQLSTPASEPALPTQSPQTLLQQARASRGDVLKAQSQLQDTEDALNNAMRDRWLPDSSLNLGFSNRPTASTSGGTSVTAGLNLKNGIASLTGSLPLTSSSSSTGTTTQSWSLGLSVALPLIDSSAQSEVASAQTALASQQAALETTRRAAELDVQQKYQALQNAKASITVARTTVDSANQALRTAQARLEAGTATQIDLQLASVNQQQAQRDLDNAVVQAQLAALNLQAALGNNLPGGTP